MPKPRLSKADDACHWTFSPKHYPGKPSCLKLDGKIQFHSRNDYRTSVISRELSNDFPENVHALGVRQAEKLTQVHQRNDKDNIETYVGFIQVGVETAENIVYEDHCFIIEHDPIHEENEAHCNIVLTFPETLNKPAKAKRQKMITDLIDCFSEPIAPDDE